MRLHVDEAQRSWERCLPVVGVLPQLDRSRLSARETLPPTPGRFAGQRRPRSQMQHLQETHGSLIDVGACGQHVLAVLRSIWSGVPPAHSLPKRKLSSLPMMAQAASRSRCSVPPSSGASPTASSLLSPSNSAIRSASPSDLGGCHGRRARPSMARSPRQSAQLLIEAARESSVSRLPIPGSASPRSMR